jgi:hypothetical protein
VPDYDSGWLQTSTELSGIVTLRHNLETDELFVYAMYRTEYGIHIIDMDRIQWWALDNVSIKVRLMGFSPNEQVRILIWKLLTLFNNFMFGPDNPT